MLWFDSRLFLHDSFPIRRCDMCACGVCAALGVQALFEAEMESIRRRHPDNETMELATELVEKAGANNALFKGVAALAGMGIFLVSQRCLTLVAHLRKQARARQRERAATPPDNQHEL